MTLFKQRLQILMENTSSTECKQLCSDIIAANPVTLDHTLKATVFEALSGLANKDTYTEEFVKRLGNDIKTDRLGVKEALESIKHVSVGDPSFRYKFMAFESQAAAGVPDFLVIESLIQILEPYTFDARVKDTSNKLKESINNNRTDISLKKTMWNLAKSNAYFIFKPLVSRIQEYVENRTVSGRDSLIFEMEKSGIAAFNEAKDALRSDAVSEGSTQIIGGSNNCTVLSVVSPVLFEGNSQVFYDGSNFYKSVGEAELFKLTNEEVAALPESYRESVSAFSSVTTENGVVSFFAGKDKISYNIEENKVYLNTTEVKGTEALASMGYFKFENAILGKKLDKIIESKDTIFDIDYAKKIKSKMFENSSVTIFKVGSKIYANMLNAGMMHNTFAEFSATKLAEEVKSFLGFDISESLAGFISDEKSRIQLIESEQKEIQESINELNAQAQKLNETKKTAPEFEEELSLVESKVLEEVELLQKEWSSLEMEKAAILNPVGGTVKEEEIQTSGYSTGDKVKIKGSDLSGEITGVNTTDQMVDVLLDDGTTKSYSTDQIESVEKNIDNEEGKNAKKAEDEEKETAKDKE